MAAEFDDRSGALERPRALVLLTETFADGGIQRFNRTFLAACSRLGVVCDVLSLGDTEPAHSRWQAPESVNIRVFAHKKVGFALAASAAILRGGYDFIVVGHVNLLQVVAVNVMVGGRGRARVLLIAHGIEVWNGIAAAPRRHSFAAVDLVLSVSQYTRDRMCAQLPELTHERFTLFPNALSETWTGRFSAPRPAAAPIAVPGRFLLSVTRLDRGERYKGIVSVIEALSMLADTSVRYVIAGRGEDQSFLAGVARRFGLSERVHFVGSVSDEQLAHLYRECAAFILPSGKEGFGIVFLEAMFFGAPVIAAREKGAVDVVQDGETGILVRYGDTKALAEAMLRVLNDGELRERLQRGGRSSVLDGGPFTFQAYVIRLARIFNLPVGSAGGCA